MKSVFETLEEAGNFKTLVNAIKQAGMEETLRTGGPFTCFAPTDQAFGHLPQGALDEFLNDKGKLAKLLQYHTVQDKVTSTDLKKMKTVTSLLGEKLYLETTTGTEINHVKISEMDIKCTNGIIHGIDEVMIPDMQRIVA